jgi:hypothetical protein
MNRSLTIPAGCCLFAFGALLAALQGTVGRETAAGLAPLATPVRRGDREKTMPPTLADSASKASEIDGDLLLSNDEAEQVLTKLAGEYLRPWRQWETSPRHLYSRVAPRPIPTISAKIEISTGVTSQSDGFLVATIVVSTGARSEPVPCVVDRVTKQVRLFSEGQWLSEDVWLKKAPLPRSTKP